MTGHVKIKKKRLAFSKFDVGGPEKLIINFAWPYITLVLATINLASNVLSF